MALSYKLNSLDGLPEDIAKEYEKQSDGTYMLNLTGQEKPDMSGYVPKSRLNEVIESKKEIEKSLEKIAETHLATIPDEFKDIIPKGLNYADQITFVQNCNAKGLFDKKSSNSPDSKTPGDKSKNKDLDPATTDPLSMIEAGLAENK